MWKSLGIGKRLTLSFGLVSALLLVVLLVGAYNLTAMKNEMSHASASGQKGKLASEMQAGLLNLSVAVRGAVGDMSESAITANVARIEGAQKAFDASEAAYRQLDSAAQGAEERALFKEITDGKAALAPLVADMVKNIKGYLHGEATKTLTEQFAPLATKLQSRTAALVALENESIRASDREAQATYARALSVLVVVSLIAVAVSLLFGVLATRSITAPLSRALNVAQRVAAGDLTVRIVNDRRDETGQLLSALQHMTDQLSQAVGSVRGGTDAVKGGADRLAGAARELSSAAVQQAEAASATAAAVEQVTVSIGSVADAAEELRARSAESLTATHQGSDRLQELMREMGSVQQAVSQMAESVQAFVQRTQEITGMTRQVKDIADQTNLLALNAAIEAARAGEAGRGFAVVADEVRKLAEKSSTSAARIDQITQGLEAQSGQVEQVVEQGRSALRASETAVKSVADALELSRQAVAQANRGVDEIAGSVQEQKLASSEIARHMEAVAGMVETNRSIVETAVAAINVLHGEAGRMEAAVQVFQC